MQTDEKAKSEIVIKPLPSKRQFHISMTQTTEIKRNYIQNSCLNNKPLNALLCCCCCV